MRHSVQHPHGILWYLLIASLVWLALLMVVPRPAAAEEALPHYVAVAEKSQLKFVATQNRAPVEGAFKNFSADIYFSPEKPEAGSITAEAEIGSVFTAYPEVAAQLLGAEWFDAGNFPRAALKTKAIHALPQRENDDRRYYYADADLTMHGKTVPVVLNFVLEQIDEKGAVATGNMSLQRLDFDIGQGQWKSTDAVENTVAVTFRIVAQRK